MSRQYQRNYLKQVIARIDFLSPLASLKEDLPREIGDISKEFFPIPEPKEVTGQEVLFGPQPDQVERKQTHLTEWHFFGKEREKHLLITQEYLFVEFTNYTSFELFSDHFMSVVDALFSAFGDLQIKRMGLRYINNIELSGSNKFSWQPYLNRNLLSIFKAAPDQSKISRAFHSLDLNLSDFTLRFQYGMHNPDYPAPIRRKVFVLDYDAYTTGILSKDEVHGNLPIFHDQIEKLFENSITDKLRGMMDVKQ